MKKFKRFICSGGGILAIVSTILLLAFAGFAILLGVVYGSYNGDWSFIGEILTSKFAIGVYVIIGLMFIFIVYLTIIFNRNKEI